MHRAQAADEGLERFSHESNKHEILDQSPYQVALNTVAKATLSETVVLLIESWSRMTRRQKAWVNTWLLLEATNPVRKVFSFEVFLYPLVHSETTASRFQV